jgi:carbon starvation protein CstA
MKTATQASAEGHEGDKVPSRMQSWLDRLAIGFAGVCGIHCLLTPVLLVVFPLIGSTFFVDERFHLWMLYVVIPTTTLAVFLGCRRHKDRRVVLFSSLGLMLLVAGVWVAHPDGEHAHECTEEHDHAEYHHEHEHHVWGTWLSVAGGIFLVSGHWRNHRLCRKDHCCH